MKTKRLKVLLIAFLGALITLPAIPQTNDDKDNWKNNETCLKNLSLYYEYYKHKNYRDAIGPWRIVYDECPESRESLFAYGVNMYRDFLEKESDPEKKAAYADTIMMVYDKRIEYFPKNKGDILGRKGIDLLRYRRQDGIEYIEQGYNILKQSIEIEEAKSSPVIITTFISAAITLNLNDILDAETAIKDYVVASDIIDEQLARRPSGRTKKAKEAIDQNIKEAKILTCESINNIFGPQYEENKTNIVFLEKVTGFMQDADCEFEPFYAKASVSLYELEPTSQAAYNLARLFFKKDDYKKAKDYYMEAIERSINEDDKANYYYQLGAISQQYLDNPSEAVRYASEAAKLKPNWGDPFILMGSAFIAGNSSLGEEFNRRTAYWVAVDMFQKARLVDPTVSEKATNLINEYQTYFPTKEELFFRSIEEGETYKVGGWINRSTTARSK